MNALRMAQDEVEQKMAKELSKALQSQGSTTRLLEEARARCAELQKDLEKMTQSKIYITDAFETSRKEAARLRAENDLANEELGRLRSLVEEMRNERMANGVGRRAVERDLHALELERDVMGRALGAATKQLFGKQQAAAAAREAKEAREEMKAATRPTTPVMKKQSQTKPSTGTGRALNSPKGQAVQPTGGARSRTPLGGGSRRG